MSVSRLTFCIALCALIAACGEEQAPTTPTTPTPPVPVFIGQDGLTLQVTTARADFQIDRGGGPGLIRYQLNCWIRIPEGFYRTTKTLQKLEYWVIGPDGSFYDNKVLGSVLGEKLGGVSNTVGRGCPTISLEDRDPNRPPAATFRVRLEYTFDSGSPTGDTQVLTDEAPVVATVPLRPVMTGLTMTSDVPGNPPRRVEGRLMTFVAAGTGGRPPYQYQWRYGNNVVLKDWDTSPRFEWDGVVPGAISPVGSADVTAMARSAGGTEAEVMKIMNVFLR